MASTDKLGMGGAFMDFNGQIIKLLFSFLEYKLEVNEYGLEIEGLKNVYAEAATHPEFYMAADLGNDVDREVCDKVLAENPNLFFMSPTGDAIIFPRVSKDKVQNAFAKAEQEYNSKLRSNTFKETENGFYSNNKFIPKRDEYGNYLDRQGNLHRNENYKDIDLRDDDAVIKDLHDRNASFVKEEAERKANGETAPYWQADQNGNLVDGRGNLYTVIDNDGRYFNTQANKVVYTEPVKRAIHGHEFFKTPHGNMIDHQGNVINIRNEYGDYITEQGVVVLNKAYPQNEQKRTAELILRDVDKDSKPYRLDADDNFRSTDGDVIKVRNSAGCYVENGKYKVSQPAKESVMRQKTFRVNENGTIVSTDNKIRLNTVCAPNGDRIGIGKDNKVIFAANKDAVTNKTEAERIADAKSYMEKLSSYKGEYTFTENGNFVNVNDPDDIIVGYRPDGTYVDEKTGFIRDSHSTNKEPAKTMSLYVRVPGGFAPQSNPSQVVIPYRNEFGDIYDNANKRAILNPAIKGNEELREAQVISQEESFRIASTDRYLMTDAGNMALFRDPNVIIYVRNAYGQIKTEPDGHIAALSHEGIEQLREEYGLYGVLFELGNRDERDEEELEREIEEEETETEEEIEETQEEQEEKEEESSISSEPDIVEDDSQKSKSSATQDNTEPTPEPFQDNVVNYVSDKDRYAYTEEYYDDSSSGAIVSGNPVVEQAVIDPASIESESPSDDVLAENISNTEPSISESAPSDAISPAEIEKTSYETESPANQTVTETYAEETAKNTDTKASETHEESYTADASHVSEESQTKENSSSEPSSASSEPSKSGDVVESSNENPGIVEAAAGPVSEGAASVNAAVASASAVIDDAKFEASEKQVDQIMAEQAAREAAAQRAEYDTAPSAESVKPETYNASAPTADAYPAATVSDPYANEENYPTAQAAGSPEVYPAGPSSAGVGSVGTYGTASYGSQDSSNDFVAMVSGDAGSAQAAQPQTQAETGFTSSPAAKEAQIPSAEPYANAKASEAAYQNEYGSSNPYGEAKPAKQDHKGVGTYQANKDAINKTPDASGFSSPTGEGTFGAADVAFGAGAAMFGAKAGAASAVEPAASYAQAQAANQEAPHKSVGTAQANREALSAFGESPSQGNVSAYGAAIAGAAPVIPAGTASYSAQNAGRAAGNAVYSYNSYQANGTRASSRQQATVLYNMNQQAFNFDTMHLKSQLTLDGRVEATLKSTSKFMLEPALRSWNGTQVAQVFTKHAQVSMGLSKFVLAKNALHHENGNQLKLYQQTVAYAKNNKNFNDTMSKMFARNGIKATQLSGFDKSNLESFQKGLIKVAMNNNVLIRQGHNYVINSKLSMNQISKLMGIEGLSLDEQRLAMNLLKNGLKIDSLQNMASTGTAQIGRKYIMFGVEHDTTISAMNDAKKYLEKANHIMRMTNSVQGRILEFRQRLIAQKAGISSQAWKTMPHGNKAAVMNAAKQNAGNKWTAQTEKKLSKLYDKQEKLNKSVFSKNKQEELKRETRQQINRVGRKIKKLTYDKLPTRTRIRMVKRITKIKSTKTVQTILKVSKTVSNLTVAVSNAITAASGPILIFIGLYILATIGLAVQLTITYMLLTMMIDRFFGNDKSDNYGKGNNVTATVLASNQTIKQTIPSELQYLGVDWTADNKLYDSSTLAVNDDQSSAAVINCTEDRRLGVITEGNNSELSLEKATIPGDISEETPQDTPKESKSLGKSITDWFSSITSAFGKDVANLLSSKPEAGTTILDSVYNELRYMEIDWAADSKMYGTSKKPLDIYQMSFTDMDLNAKEYALSEEGARDTIGTWAYNTNIEDGYDDPEVLTKVWNWLTGGESAAETALGGNGKTINESGKSVLEGFYGQEAFNGIQKEDRKILTAIDSNEIEFRGKPQEGKTSNAKQIMSMCQVLYGKQVDATLSDMMDENLAATVRFVWKSFWQKMESSRIPILGALAETEGWSWSAEYRQYAYPLMIASHTQDFYLTQYIYPTKYTKTDWETNPDEASGRRTVEAGKISLDKEEEGAGQAARFDDDQEVKKGSVEDTPNNKNFGNYGIDGADNEADMSASVNNTNTQNNSKVGKLGTEEEGGSGKVDYQGNDASSDAWKKIEMCGDVAAVESNGMYGSEKLSNGAGVSEHNGYGCMVRYNFYYGWEGSFGANSDKLYYGSSPDSWTLTEEEKAAGAEEHDTSTCYDVSANVSPWDKAMDDEDCTEVIEPQKENGFASDCCTIDMLEQTNMAAECWELMGNADEHGPYYYDQDERPTDEQIANDERAAHNNDCTLDEHYDKHFQSSKFESLNKLTNDGYTLFCIKTTTIGADVYVRGPVEREEVGRYTDEYGNEQIIYGPWHTKVYILRWIHNCIGDHPGFYCGGHLQLRTRGVIYGFSTEQEQHIAITPETSSDGGKTMNPDVQASDIPPAIYTPKYLSKDEVAYEKESSYYYPHDVRDSFGEMLTSFDINEYPDSISEASELGKKAIIYEEDQEKLKDAKDIFDIDVLITRTKEQYPGYKSQTLMNSVPGWESWTIDNISQAATTAETDWADLYNLVDSDTLVGGVLNGDNANAAKELVANKLKEQLCETIFGEGQTTIPLTKTVIKEVNTYYTDGWKWFKNPDKEVAVKNDQVYSYYGTPVTVDQIQNRFAHITYALNSVGKVGYAQSRHIGLYQNVSGHLTDCSGYVCNIWRDKFDDKGTLTTEELVDLARSQGALHTYSGPMCGILPGDIIVRNPSDEDAHALLYVGTVQPSKIYVEDSTGEAMEGHDSDEFMAYTIDCSTMTASITDVNGKKPIKATELGNTYSTNNYNDPSSISTKTGNTRFAARSYLQGSGSGELYYINMDALDTCPGFDDMFNGITWGDEHPDTINDYWTSDVATARNTTNQIREPIAIGELATEKPDVDEGDWEHTEPEEEDPRPEDPADDDHLQYEVPSGLCYPLPVDLPGLRISSPYGYRKHPIHGDLRLHKGVDFAAPGINLQPVYAVEDGTIVMGNPDPNGYGKHIILYNDRSGSEAYSYLYAHLSSIVVSGGQHVTKGQVIGYVGSTGGSTGPHLHFEVHTGHVMYGNTIDPELLFGSRVPTQQMAEEQQASKQPSNPNWDGSVISASAGYITGPSGGESYYHMNMSNLVNVVHNNSYNDISPENMQNVAGEYHVSSDGFQMLGDYIMVAADLDVHPRGSLVETSAGMGVVVDTGLFANYSYMKAYAASRKDPAERKALEQRIKNDFYKDENGQWQSKQLDISVTWGSQA